MNGEENKSFITCNCTTEPCSGETEEVLCHRAQKQLPRRTDTSRRSAVNRTVSCNANEGYESGVGMEIRGWSKCCDRWLSCQLIALLEKAFAPLFLLNSSCKRRIITFIPFDILVPPWVLLSGTSLLWWAASQWNGFQWSLLKVKWTVSFLTLLEAVKLEKPQ